MTYVGIALCSILLLCPITLDFIMPLNESRTRIVHYVTIFSDKSIIYMDILCLNYMLLAILVILSATCTESILGLYSYHTSIMFKIIGWVKLLYSSHMILTTFHTFIKLKLTKCDRNLYKRNAIWNIIFYFL